MKAEMDLREKEWRATAATHYTSYRVGSPVRTVPPPMGYSRAWGPAPDYRMGSPVRYGSPYRFGDSPWRRPGAPLADANAGGKAQPAPKEPAKK